MQPLPHPSASPLWSFCSRPEGPITYRPNFSETLKTVVGWLRGREPDWRQRVKEARIVDRLVEELEPEPEPADVKAKR
jgi:hypothetical protein